MSKVFNSVVKFNLGLLFIVFSLLLTGCGQKDPAIISIEKFISENHINNSKSGWKQILIKPPMVKFSADKKYLWHIQTNQGNIDIELKAQESPMHVSSTIYLTILGFYDQLTFHRVIPGFMAQGGDPLDIGIGGPGYYYMGEFSSNLSHSKAGTVSMANAGAGTDGSQFFITFAATPHLDGGHTIFGEVIEGFATLEKLEALGSRSGTPKQKLIIIKAAIEVK